MEREQRALAAADEIVLQYPTHWYSMSGLMKQRLDDVMVREWAYGTGTPGALAGKILRVVTSTGGTEEAYRPGGFHRWTDADLLVPIEATARGLGLTRDEPLVVHGAREVTDDQLADFGDRYGELVGVRAPVSGLAS